MRTIVVLIFMSIAGPCFAEDPLETLNTVEDTLSTMQQTLKTRIAEETKSRADKYIVEAAVKREPFVFKAGQASALKTASTQVAMSPLQHR